MVSALAAAVAALVAGAAPTGFAGAAAVQRPSMVWKPVHFGAERRAQTAAYARRHYGLRTWRLRAPKVIVQHWTGSATFASVFATFASNAPDPELGERPGTCTHFVVARDGRIYQLVRLDTMCRHTVGLNWTAIGIEHVGRSDREVLSNRRQLAASQQLTVWLMSRFGIELRDVIGHSESLTSPYHRERLAAWRCQTHGDWSRASMRRYRAELARVARRAGVPLGRAPRPRRPAC